MERWMCTTGMQHAGVLETNSSGVDMEVWRYEGLEGDYRRVVVNVWGLEVWRRAGAV